MQDRPLPSDVAVVKTNHNEQSDFASKNQTGFLYIALYAVLAQNNFVNAGISLAIASSYELLFASAKPADYSRLTKGTVKFGSALAGSFGFFSGCLNKTSNVCNKIYEKCSRTAPTFKRA